MSSYYYLMAQLPGILPSGQLSVTYAAFKETALRFLTPDDSRILNCLSLEPPRLLRKTGSRSVDRWLTHERSLRLTLRRLRTEKLGRQTASSPSDDALINECYEAVALAQGAYSLDDPLEAERYLDRGRMAFLDQLRSGHYFDSDAVFIYGLTLLLRERGEFFTTDAGRASYKAIYTRILEIQK